MTDSITIKNLPDSYEQDSSKASFADLVLKALDPSPNGKLSWWDKYPVKESLNQMDKAAGAVRDKVVTPEEARAYWPTLVAKRQERYQSAVDFNAPSDADTGTFSTCDVCETEAKEALERAKAIGARL